MRFTNIITASAIFAMAHGAAVDKRALTGEATYYGGNTSGGTCSFSTYTIPAGIFGTALSDSNWEASANCGTCVSVTGPKGASGKTSTITAMVVDQCPGCGPNHLDLFPGGFSALANPTLGKIPIVWNYVDCPITSPISVRNKEGVSAWWFSMQVINANKKVASLDVSADGGKTWQQTVRQPYNFFQKSSGTGTTVVDVRVTSASGDAIVIKSVPVAQGKGATASRNFK
ncbi:hypothetical protein VTL71DRAFT_2878 [Oculimacula yallundae]|uniref:Expansin-like EG45 domain-containing protein n=1 Tax=Oculimacula yallundae TaxID=86028 RepID=A0ABR4C7E4_9HELO